MKTSNRPNITLTFLVLTLFLPAVSNASVVQDSTRPVLQEPVEWIVSVMNDTSSSGTSKVGNPKTIESPYGEAVVFDGKQDAFFVDWTPLEGLWQFTVEVIFRPDSGGPAAQRFLHMGEMSGDRIMLETRLTADNQWYLDAHLRSRDTAVTLIDSLKLHATGKWYHVAFVVDKGSMDTYVNWKHELSGQMRFLPLKEGKTSLGVRRNKIYWYKGAVYKLRITPKALMPREFIR